MLSNALRMVSEGVSEGEAVGDPVRVHVPLATCSMYVVLLFLYSANADYAPAKAVFRLQCWQAQRMSLLCCAQVCYMCILHTPASVVLCCFQYPLCHPHPPLCCDMHAVVISFTALGLGVNDDAGREASLAAQSANQLLESLTHAALNAFSSGLETISMPLLSFISAYVSRLRALVKRGEQLPASAQMHMQVSAVEPRHTQQSACIHGMDQAQQGMLDVARVVCSPWIAAAAAAAVAGLFPHACLWSLNACVRHIIHITP